MDPRYIKYTKPFDRVGNIELERGTVEYTRFGPDYFSGANVSVYFGDILISDIFGLQFEMQEQFMPIYGYGSYTWDAIAKGQRIINGSFNIYFKETAYLHQLMKTLNSTHGVQSTPNPFRYLPEERDLETLLAKDGVDFDAIASSYEEAIWGDTSASAEFGSKIKNQDINPYFTPLDYNLAEKGFTILIAYGPEARRQASRVEGLDPITTVQSIVDVHLTGVSTMVNATGDPIYETYTFVAKDLNSNAKQGVFVRGVDLGKADIRNVQNNMPLLKRGDSDAFIPGGYIAQIQQYLKALTRSNGTRYYTGGIDGVFGSRTDLAVRAFQEDYGLAVDGIVGPATYSKLIQVYNSIVNRQEIE